MRPCRIHSAHNVIYNLYLYRHWRHLQKGKKVRKYKGEVYIDQQVLGAVIADVLGIINIIDIADVADIVTDIADIVNITDIAVETGRRV
jgi:hypothetical protein